MYKEKPIHGKQSVFFNRFVLQLLFIMFFVEFVKGALLINMLPIYMKSGLGLSTFVIGLAMSSQYIGDNLFRSPIGWVVDKIGYRLSMLFGVVLTFAAVVLMASTGHFGWIVLASALLGVGTSPLWPCVITGATEMAGDKARATMMSVVYMAWLSGVGLGPVVINFFIGSSYDLAFRILIGIMAAVIVVTLFLPGKLTHSTGMVRTPQEEEREAAKRRRKAQLSRAQRVHLYMREIRKSLRNVGLVFYIAMFAQTFAIGMLTPILTIYARRVLQLSPMEYNIFLVSGGVITVLFLIPIGKLVDRWGTKWFLHAGFLLTSFTLLFFTSSKILTIVFVMAILLGIGYALIIPAWNALIASVIPEEKRGAIWGFFLTIEGAGTVLGPLVSGKLWDNIGPHASFMASGFILLVLFVLHLFISFDKKLMIR